MTNREAYTPINGDADFNALLHAFPYPCLARSAVLELQDQRADRVKLQGEIERLTHENAGLREHLNHAGETLLDAADRAETKQTDIEALAERLAKVEDRLSGIDGLRKQLAALASRLNGAATDARLDQVCEIIGARIGGLEERITKLESRIDFAEQGQGYAIVVTSPLPFGVQPSPPGFPTGAATTVEDAIAQVEETGAESEPLKPQRGDRVRLEGARTMTGRPLDHAWYDVVGSDDAMFQVAEPGGAKPWINHGDIHLKEVRRGAANLPE